MELECLHLYIIQKKQAFEVRPFGPEYLVFKVMGKMFALISITLNPLRINLKCDPDDALMLRDIYPSVQPGYHMNKRHWNTVVLDDTLPDDLVYSMIDDSYDLVVKSLPKHLREELKR